MAPRLTSIGRAVISRRGCALAAAAGAAVLLVQAGLIDAVRVSGADAGWQIDETLFLALSTLSALFATDRVNRRRSSEEMPHLTVERPLQFERVFERRLATVSTGDTNFCVAAIGLDWYQAASRTLGYGFAAKLLRAVRERLEQHDPTLLIERLGPDTLGVLFAAEDMGSAQAVMATIAAVAAPAYMLDDLAVGSPLTFGVAGPAPAAALRETVEQAQSALNEARRTGKRQAVFDPREQHRVANNVELMKELRAAIAADSLELHYQPKWSARTGEIDSVEALVRWPHPTRGSVSPGEFIPLAEESGDVQALTWWVLERAARDWQHLADQAKARPIYVNVSAQLIGDSPFAERLLATLRDQPERIGIEITETAVLANPDCALNHLQMLADAGIAIAIDDYGVGLSSLSYLKRLPATELKIDMMFITDLCDSHRDPMIVRSTIDLAHGLGLKVTAEGVDKPEALALLKIMGCDLIQGYQIAAPMPLAALSRFISDHDADAEHVPDCAAQLLAFSRSAGSRPLSSSRKSGQA